MFRSSSNQLLSFEAIRDKLKISLLPLLRCAALFYHHLTDTTWPGESGKSTKVFFSDIQMFSFI